MPEQADLPAANLVLREQRGRVFYEAKFRYRGEQIWRRIGPAWMEVNPDLPAVGARAERFRPRRGRVGEGYFDERAAHVRAAELVSAYVRDEEKRSTAARERAAAGPTFREVAHAYLDWLERIKGAKPATLRQHRSDLGEPGVSYRRGAGTTNGHIMAALGDLPAARIGGEEIEALLDTVTATGVSPAPSTACVTSFARCSASGCGRPSSGWPRIR